MKQLSPRQIHLDFHTSENIPGIGSTFDPEAFAKTAKDASISSITVFARGHHGWLYYPSKKFPELVHPNLEYKNLLLDQVRALHKVGINAPVYITVQWDYHHATTRPEWLIRKKDGSHEGGSFTEPGFYQSLCVNSGYWDFLKEQTIEVCEMLGDELDGLFFDIVGIRPCWCASCRAEMKKLGIDASDDEAVRDFAKIVIDRFKKNMTEVVRQYNKDCTIFYNAGHVGPCTKDSADAYTHFELESLPSGSWGYLHFPLTARYARKLGKDCMGMTGKFHTEWGDFHSLKNLAALEFECFRMLSFGFASSIGDQLEPNGTLNPATYRLIGKVYSQFAEREEWARPSVPVVEAAVVTSESPRVEHQIPESLMGAVQMLEELAIQFDVIDPEMALDGYKLVILPDDLVVCECFQKKLEEFVAKGGKVIACAKGGQNKDGKYPACFGAKSNGPRNVYPDFLIADGKLAEGLEPENEYVIYMQGEALESAGAETVLSARAPYFKREKDFFCSHRYTPSAKGEPYPAVLQKGGVILFGHPIFEQYRKNAPFWCKKLISNAIDLLLGERIVQHDGPSTMTISVLDQPEENRTNLHILSYVPVRKSATIDIIEERTVLRNVTVKVNIPRKFTEARLVPENIPLEVKNGAITIPEINGYAIVELK
ncbi:MAG: beta-galactosidase trimerization domain-containing protein [Candidatus Merdivicinus sp.]|jgi:hypothetical protein